MSVDRKRGSYGRRLEFHTHPKYGGKVPIYIDTGKCLFSAVIGDTVLQDENLHKLRKLVDEALKNQHALEWIPVLQITFGHGWYYRDDDARNGIYSHAELNAKRYWIAQKIDKKWIQSDWDEEYYPEFNKKKIQVGDRLERSESFNLIKRKRKYPHEETEVLDIKLPYTERSSDRDETPTYYLPYTEELWSTLQELGSRIDSLYKRIIEILGSEEKRKLLMEQVGKLLPEGKS